MYTLVKKDCLLIKNKSEMYKKYLVDLLQPKDFLQS